MASLNSIIFSYHRSERYLGMWRNDRQHGPGILVAQNKFYYSGIYDNGEKKVGMAHYMYYIYIAFISFVTHSCSVAVTVEMSAWIRTKSGSLCFSPAVHYWSKWLVSCW